MIGRERAKEQTMNDDLIKRSDAIRAVSKVDDYGDGIGFEVRSHCLVELELVPSADRPQGEWVDAEIPLESGGSMPIQVCNLCKTFYPLAYTGGGHRFCPNCGARMKGADDE